MRALAAAVRLGPSSELARIYGKLSVSDALGRGLAIEAEDAGHESRSTQMVS